MQVKIRPHRFGGAIRVPGSKSHTIRRILIASLADGISQIDAPLDSLDTRSCVSVCRTLGAEIKTDDPARWIIKGRGTPFPNASQTAGFLERPPYARRLETLEISVSRSQALKPEASPLSPTFCNVGNSGTTLYLALAAAAIGNTPVVFSGDEQIRRRSATPLLNALEGLGAEVESAPGGCAPIKICGPLKGGRISVSCTTSQYLSPLLIAVPLAPQGAITEIDVPLLNEKPYIEMTLSYLKAQNIPYEAKKDFSYFRIPGGANYKPMNGAVPGDFSSAAFPAAAAIVSGGELTLLGLDPEDTQGDKEFFSHIEKMGATVTWTPDAGCKVSAAGFFKGGEFDLNATPDMLPVMAILACFAKGDTRLYNADSARIKESDRISVMASELKKLGVQLEELPDGLIIHGKGSLQGGKVDSRGDHRIAMAFAAGALGADGEIEISGAESADVSYPGFLELLSPGED